MKQFKQLAALFLAFALVVGLFSAPTVAYAADTADALVQSGITDSMVTIDYVNEVISVDKTSSQTIYYTTKWAEKSHAKTDWDEAYVVASTGASIDFSNTAANKAVSIFITEDTTKKPLEVKLTPQETTLTVAFSGVAETTAKSKIKVVNDWSEITELTAGCDDADTWAYGFLCATVKDDQKNTVALTTAEVRDYLQFRKGTTGQWKSIAELDVRKYAAMGAQLYFRIAPTNTPSASGAALTLGRASKEVKVTYAKQANAPKVTINGVTKEIKLNKAMEYRVGIASGTSVTYQSWVKVSTDHMNGNKVKTIYLKDLKTVSSGSAWSYSEGNEGQVIQVRTAASEKAVASKIRTIKLNKAEAPTVSTASGISFELVKNTTYDKGIKVTNNSTAAAIQVAVVSGAPTDVNAKTVKWTTINAKGDKTKTVILKGAALEAGDRIIYRFATVKDNTKTAANEFKVSSNFNTYNFKTQLPLAQQSITVSGVSVVKGGSTVSVTSSAITTGQALVKVTNTATAAAIEVNVDLAATNISDAASVTVDCVNALSVDAAKASSSTVKLVADGKIGTTGKLKLTLTEAVAAGDTFFRVSVDGYKFLVKVTFAK